MAPALMRDEEVDRFTTLYSCGAIVVDGIGAVVCDGVTDTP